MNLVKSEKLEKSMHELQFSVDAETYLAAINVAFKREGKKYNVPGFRKGKATRAMIEKMYGADVFHYDAINDLFPDAYEAAVEEAGIQPVGRPEADIVSESVEEGVVLKVVFPVKPEIQVGTYTGLAAVKKVNTVQDSVVEEELARMQDRNARIITREGKAENGDTADLDFEGFVDDVAFEGGKAENYSLVLGSGNFIPGFEEQVVGHEAGEEFNVNVTFPEEYQAEELAGKAAVFKIKLHEVKAKEMPALDDEFAKDVSEYDTLDELKNSIRTNQQAENDKQSDLAVENDLIEQVIASIEGDIPEAMYESRMDEMVRDYEYRLMQQGLQLDMYLQYMGQTMETFRASFMEQAEKQVKIRLALEVVATQEKLEASEEDLNNEMQRMADAYQMDVEKVKELVNADDVKADLAINKAIDFIKENANITEEEAVQE